jgi:uncharacterized protein YbjT (DUF2867 family)
VSSVLVTGATGRVGGAALRALRREGVPAVAAVRPGSEGRVEAPWVPFDFLDSDTWAGALEGVDRILLVRPPAIGDVDPTLNAFVDRAGQRPVQVAFLSVTRAEDSRFIPHARVERHLRESGVPCTLLRAGFFAQNLCDAYLEDIRDDDRLVVPAGQGRVAWVDTRDVGEAAARALVTPEPGVRIWTLTGPEACTFGEVAEVLSEVLERRIGYTPASVPGYVRHLRRDRGLPWSRILVQTVLHTALRFGLERRVDPTLERVLGRRPRTVADTVRDHRRLWER